MDEKRCNARMINKAHRWHIGKNDFQMSTGYKSVAIKKLHSSTIIGRQFDNEQKLPTAFLCWHQE